mmetsp:Transcript_79778/g.234676  ORF Transcript_79778/g.234676 Transcript_79778/m.234676 type:complete len:208 (-) Transcript_79778:473-1096(-)
MQRRGISEVQHFRRMRLSSKQRLQCDACELRLLLHVVSTALAQELQGIGAIVVLRSRRRSPLAERRHERSRTLPTGEVEGSLAELVDECVVGSMLQQQLGRLRSRLRATLGLRPPTCQEHEGSAPRALTRRARLRPRLQQGPQCWQAPWPQAGCEQWRGASPVLGSVQRCLPVDEHRHQRRLPPHGRNVKRREAEVVVHEGVSTGLE